ncbi:hypothetical protein Hanom_Chr15g01368131 [Helianthus anomalus]
MIQSRDVLLRKSTIGFRRPSQAILRYGTLFAGKSRVDSAFSGRRSMFLGVDMKEMLWPLEAISFASSRNGIRWPNASHGSIAMWSLTSPFSAMDTASCLLFLVMVM